MYVYMRISLCVYTYINYKIYLIIYNYTTHSRKEKRENTQHTTTIHFICKCQNTVCYLFQINL